MKNIGLLFCFSLLMLYLPDAHAQVDWQWASGGGSTSDSSLTRLEEKALDIAVDKDGNSYVISRINYSNPAIAGNPVTVYSDAYYNDIALAAFDCSGSYKWSKIIGSYYDDFVQGVETDTLGNVYVVGKVKPGYQGGSVKPVNFSTDTIIPYSANDNEYKKSIFLVQYDAQGNFQWLRMPQADGISSSDGRQILSLDLSVSPNGEAYWLVQIQPGTYADGAFVNTTPGWSLYVFHYDINGVFQGAVPLDFTMDTKAFRDLDWERDHHSGRFYVAGYYLYNDEDLINPILGNNTVTHSMYAGAFDAQGDFLWLHENTETYSNPAKIGMAIGEMTALSLDHQGNLYLTGRSTDGDFFAGGEIDHQPLPPPSSPDYYTNVPFVIKLDSEGNLLWINNADFSGLGFPCNDIVVNGKEVAITGSYGDFKWGNVDIDVEPNTGGQAYLIQLDKNTGNFISLDSIPNVYTSHIIGTAIESGVRGGYFVGGMFGGTIAAGSHQVTSNGGPGDFFMAKFGENNCNCTLPEADFTYQADGQGGVSFTYTGTPGYDELEWGFGDGNISSASAPTHSYAQNGLYWVCVTVYNSCGYDTYCQEVDTNLNTRVFEATEVRVYPNPAKTRVFVSTEEALNYSLYDLSGRKVKSGKLGKGESVIGLAELSAGIYLLRVEDGHGQINVMKLIKE